jgi:hypothetical protein
MTALQYLNALADAAKATKHPNVPAFGLVKSKYSDKDANGLTICVVDFLNLSGHFATRLASTGTYRADINQYIPSQQRSGLPDVMAVINGQAVFVEVKIGKDRLSAKQQGTIKELLRAGAWCFVTKTFEEFYSWYTAQFQPAFIA